MAALAIDQWARLSEDALWNLATDWRLDAEVREEAMWRWLFPDEYGYGWAGHRVQRLRARYWGLQRDKGIASLVTMLTPG